MANPIVGVRANAVNGLCTVAEAAKIVGVGEDTVILFIDAGLPFLTLGKGGRKLVSIPALLAAISACMESTQNGGFDPATWHQMRKDRQDQQAAKRRTRAARVEEADPEDCYV